MADNLNQPRADDAVLGDQNPPPVGSTVLGGMPGIKWRFANGAIAQRITLLSEALHYGKAGLDFIVQALQDNSDQVRRTAYLLLWEQTDPKIRQALDTYIPTDMVAWWRLDETQGKMANDSVGGHHGTIEGATPSVMVPGRMPGLGGAAHPNHVHLESERFVEFVLPQGLGSALQFDGNDFIEVPHHSALSFDTGDFSICVGIKTGHHQPDARGDTTKVIVDKRVDRSGSTQGYCYYIAQDRLYLQLADGVGVGLTNYNSEFFIADNKWHHVAVTVDRDSSEGGRWYVDGLEVGKRFNPTNRQGSLHNPKPLRFGRRCYNVAWQSLYSPGFFQGCMSDVRLFKRALAAPEIQAIYKMVGVPLKRSLLR